MATGNDFNTKKSLNFKHKNSKPKSIVNGARRISLTDPDRVLFARKGGDEAILSTSDLGGENITVEEASKLKTLCWGGANVVPPPEWIKSGLVFHEQESVYAYGLKCVKGSSKAFQMCLQGYIMKHLLFEGKHKKSSKTGILKPNENTQRDVLIGAVSELLWKVGEKKFAVLAIPGSTPVIEPTIRFSVDELTEKLHLFKCSREDEVKSVVKKNIHFFMEEKGGGLASLLYSVVLSKGFENLKEEMQNQHMRSLIDTEDKITLCLSNLILTGIGTPFLHNGIISPDDIEASNFDFGDGKLGIINRNEIGFLLWRGSEENTESFNLGSRFKTPVLPIWITSVNHNWGILFNPNKDLMKSYAAENRFNLYYYSNPIIKEKDKEKAKRRAETVLTIDTRSTRTVNKMLMMDSEDFDLPEENPLEKTIQTK